MMASIECLLTANSIRAIQVTSSNAPAVTASIERPDKPLCLLHVLPKGLVRVRHYGWLSPAAHKAFLRVRLAKEGAHCITLSVAIQLGKKGVQERSKFIFSNDTCAMIWII